MHLHRSYRLLIATVNSIYCLPVHLRRENPRPPVCMPRNNPNRRRSRKVGRRPGRLSAREERRIRVRYKFPVRYCCKRELNLRNTRSFRDPFDTARPEIIIFLARLWAKLRPRAARCTDTLPYHR